MKKDLEEAMISLQGNGRERFLIEWEIKETGVESVLLALKGS